MILVNKCKTLTCYTAIVYHMLLLPEQLSLNHWLWFQIDNVSQIYILSFLVDYRNSEKFDKYILHFLFPLDFLFCTLQIILVWGMYFSIPFLFQHNFPPFRSIIIGSIKVKESMLIRKANIVSCTISNTILY